VEYTVMIDPIDQLGDIDEALNLVHEAASRYIASLPDRRGAPADRGADSPNTRRNAARGW
jgi:hypothetical protein